MMNNKLTDQLYNDYYKFIELIKQGHTVYPNGILNQIISLYTHLTGQGVCIHCNEEIETMIYYLRKEIKQYETNKNINL